MIPHAAAFKESNNFTILCMFITKLATIFSFVIHFVKFLEKSGVGSFFLDPLNLPDFWGVLLTLFLMGDFGNKSVFVYVVSNSWEYYIIYHKIWIFHIQRSAFVLVKVELICVSMDFSFNNIDYIRLPILYKFELCDSDKLSKHHLFHAVLNLINVRLKHNHCCACEFKI